VKLEEHWGGPPGDIGVSDKFHFCGKSFGNVIVAIQPPRGYGVDPIAVYHSPDLPPTHHYLAFYRWLDEVFKADACIHLGKHGTLEWLPGKGVGLSGECFTDLALGSMPFIYPFVVNDPGEGTQAKRRAHAVIVDHMVPPLTNAGLYDELAEIEILLDEHARVSMMDPAKLEKVRELLWESMVKAEIHRDLALKRERVESHPWLLDGNPDLGDASFDTVVPEIDGYLCELKDSMIRGGLHILGQSPSGDSLIDTVVSITKVQQGSVGSYRNEVATKLSIAHDSMRTSEIEILNKALHDSIERIINEGPDETSSIERWIKRWLLPAIDKTEGEIDSVLRALEGQFVEPGPSGAPSRGMAYVLPTGRNFYSIDPKAIPSPLAYEIGVKLADQVISEFKSQEGSFPTSVAVVAWGTSAMRTCGDDIAQIFAFIGVKPTWDEVSGRVTGVELIPSDELNRPRVDVTVRMSGFFRDAFPHVVELLDQAFQLASLADDKWPNPLASSGGDVHRIFGPKPGSYGSGILHVLESGAWEDDKDLTAIYLKWGGYTYGGGRDGEYSAKMWAERLGATEIAIKNQDNREHDIFDSDDYMQDHGGMINAIRTLSGKSPMAVFGDTSNPRNLKVTSLEQEAARVVRTRVVNPKWIEAMMNHGYKGAFEMAATVDYLYGYDATARIIEDWMYEEIVNKYVADKKVKDFFKQSNPWALGAIAEKLLEANRRGLFKASQESLETLHDAILESERWQESR
ncbi:MAG: cobaltochelatase subunit CobN, partial [Acidimicrobiales bacterium]|nr:cobaltochelatase subunit CobN [Acidimicrobiales bacterium]